MSGAGLEVGSPVDDSATDHADLADRLLGQHVITHDPEGAVNAIHAARTAEARAQLVELLHAGPWRSAGLVPLLERLRVRPDDPQAYRAAAASLEAELRSGVVSLSAFLPALSSAEERGWTRYRLGTLVGAAPVPDPSTTDTGALAALAAPAISPDKTRAELAVVLPVRFAHEGDKRLRNCLASIHALNAQVGDRTRFRLIVVEQGERPLGQRLIERLVDDYVYVFNPGPFNKSWALNVGALTADGARYLCLIDADSLVPPDFVSGVIDRMRGGTQAELPFTELLFLDQSAAVEAITQRLVVSGGGHPKVDLRTMRGFALLGVKGFCICVTRDIFEQVDGYDERYVVWGDDDNEFYSQIAERVPIPRRPGSMLHLWHERPTMMAADGKRPNSHLIGVPRPADREPIGRRDKYARQVERVGRP